MDIVEFIRVIVPFIASLVGWLMFSPSKQEMKVKRIKDTLRIAIRFRLSSEIANSVPNRNRQSFEIYFEQLKDNINEYLNSNSKLLIDYLKCKSLSDDIIAYLRIFKYVAVIMPIIGMILMILLPSLLTIEFRTWYYFSITILVTITILIPLLSMERTKDKFYDLCDEYEITERESSKD